MPPVAAFRLLSIGCIGDCRADAAARGRARRPSMAGLGRGTGGSQHEGTAAARCDQPLEPRKSSSWEPLRPERVCEVAYDHMQGNSVPTCREVPALASRQAPAGLPLRSAGSHARLRAGPRFCESAWDKDPVFGVIGIQSGPPGRWVHSGFRGGYAGQVGDAGSGDDREDPSGYFAQNKPIKTICRELRGRPGLPGRINRM